MQNSPSRQSSLIQDIKAGKIAPIYLLAGEEAFLVTETVKQLLDLLLDSGSRDFNLDIFDGSQISVREILSAVEVYPVIADWRVVLVNDPDFLQPTSTNNSISPTPEPIEDAEDLDTVGAEIVDPLFTGTPAEPTEPAIVGVDDFIDLDPAERFLSWLTGILPKFSVLILACRHKIDARSRIVKEIRRLGQYVEFPQTDRPTQNDPLFQQVKEQVTKAGKQINLSTYNLMRQRTGQDAHRIFQELEKAIAYVGDRERIEDKDIRGLITEIANESIFALTDAVGRKNVSHALLSLHRLLQSGEAAIKVNALIARQIRLLLQARLLVEEKLLQEDAGRSNYQVFNQRVFQPLAEKASHRLPESAQLNLLKQNPYAAYKIAQPLRFFGQVELENALESVLQADIELKSSSLPTEQILEELICDLCRRPVLRSRR